MAEAVGRRVRPVPWTQVTFGQGWLGERVETNRRVTLWACERQCRETGRIDAFRLSWKPGEPNPPHIFWDSDIAKWLEACCYSLAVHPDPELRRVVDEVVDLIVAAQQPDGYLNVHFTIVEPDKRWTNLRDWHELYAAGHLMEAAVAHQAATGEGRLLDALCRYADCIATVFGTGPGQKRGYPGHEEIELALVKLASAANEPRYLELSRYFIDERGRTPHYYDQEAEARGDDPGNWHLGKYDYNQSHLPVREQSTAEGHSVRAMYLYSGMADIAAETGDEALWAACRRLWDNVTERRMYLTGGVGSSPRGERFTVDYDLPNETAYAETCAAIGLVFWAHRMAQIEPDRRYVDVMERALYNGVLSGLSLGGDGFYYGNPLRVDPRRHQGAFPPQRQPWFGCACCPPNIARLLASLGGYVCGTSDDALYVHLYTAGEVATEVAGGPVRLRQTTDYPWDGGVRLDLLDTPAGEWALALRLPGWCHAPELKVNGEAVQPPQEHGYATIRRAWRAGDVVELSLPMPVERVYARPALADDAGRVALQRGPLVYCLEETDNGPGLDALCLPSDAALTATFEPDLLGGVAVVRGEAKRLVDRDGALYSTHPPAVETVPLQAVPYALWANRQVGEMMVWIRSC